MKINVNEVNILGSDKRPVTVVTNIADLAGQGNVFEGYSIRAGEVLEFPDEPTVMSQPVREGSDAVVYLMTCTRNGKKSVFALGSLNKRDITGTYTCPTTAAFGPLDIPEKVEKLSGHKLRCEDMKTITVQKFDRAGNLLDGQTKEQKVPVIIYE